MLCNDPPERAVLDRSSGVQEVHVELLQVICNPQTKPSKEHRDLPWNAVRISLDDDLGSLTSPLAGRTTAAHGRSLTDLLEELRCIVSMARRSSPVARHADAGVGGLSARTHELHLSVIFDP